MAGNPTSDWLRRRAVAVFGMFVLGYLLIGSIKLVIENYRVHQDTSRLDSALVEIQQHNLELKNLLAYYQTDSYKEKEARARFNYQKPGERMVVVPQPVGEQPSITQPSTETKAPTPPSNPQQWWNYFFGKRG